MFCANPRPGRFFSTRCRKCKPCLQLRQQDWMARTVWEILASDKAVFITLTFRRKPTNGYAEFQRYAKRVRITLQRKCHSDARLRFVCASEFGERRGRYHLHGVLAVYGEILQSVSFGIGGKGALPTPVQLAPIVPRELADTWQSILPNLGALMHQMGSVLDQQRKRGS